MPDLPPVCESAKIRVFFFVRALFASQRKEFLNIGSLTRGLSPPPEREDFCPHPLSGNLDPIKINPQSYKG